MVKKSKISDPSITINPLSGILGGDILDLPKNNFKNVEQILIVGAGTSTSVPNISCLVNTADSPPCLVCLDAVGRVQRSAEYIKKNGGPPTGNIKSRNLRTNPSAVIRYRNTDGAIHDILIDCGKTFYSNAKDILMRAGIGKLDGVLLTHGHADAILGLDDLRHWSGHWPSIQPHVDIYCDAHTFEVVKSTFPYIVDTRNATGGGEVSQLQFHVFECGDLLKVGELDIQSVKVCHGKYSDGRDYYSNGFKIESLLYLSDISGIPDESLKYIKDVDVLVADCLFKDRDYVSHYGWPKTKDLINQIKPSCTVLVGMAHTIDYYSFQLELEPDLADEDGVIDKLKYKSNASFVGFDGLLLKMNQQQQ